MLHSPNSYVTLRGRDNFPRTGGGIVGSVQTTTLSEQVGHPYVTLRGRDGFIYALRRQSLFCYVP